MSQTAAVHADQILLAPADARALIRAQFPQFGDADVQPLITSGTVNAIFRIGSEATARFPLRPVDPVTLAHRLEQESAAMRELAEHCPVAVPAPLGIGRPADTFPLPWSVQTWLDGQVATPDGLAGSTPFAADLVALIAALRTADLRGRRFVGTGRGGRLPDHDAWVAECLARSAGLLDVTRLAALWARLRNMPDPSVEVMSHGDLIPANLLVRGERLVGVLDTGGFGPADPALDLVSGWHLLDRPAREVLRRELGCSDVEWLRGAAWAFEQAMGLVWYYRITNPGMSVLGRSTLDRLLDDPELTDLAGTPSADPGPDHPAGGTVESPGSDEATRS